MEEIKTTARVKLTIEVPAGSSWGADTTVNQVVTQAERETIQKVKAALSNIVGVNLLDSSVCVVMTEPLRKFID